MSQCLDICFTQGRDHADLYLGGGNRSPCLPDGFYSFFWEEISFIDKQVARKRDFLPFRREKVLRRLLVDIYYPAAYVTAGDGTGHVTHHRFLQRIGRGDIAGRIHVDRLMIGGIINAYNGVTRRLCLRSSDGERLFYQVIKERRLTRVRLA